MISSHCHSGRHLPRQHTSYAALVFMVLVSGVLLLQFTGAILAEGISLEGVMLGESPATAPQILQPLSGNRFSSLPIQVSGSCTSGLVVQIFKNSTSAGATNCLSNGSFSLQIDLFISRNDLVARQFDQFNQPSPNSAVVTVYYDAPVVAEPPSQVVRRPGQKTNDPVMKIDQLIIRSEMAFKGVGVGAELDWPIEIVGGVGPYAVEYEWGDGESNLQSSATAGPVNSKHTYVKSGNYKIIIRAIDSKGQKAVLQVMALVNVGALATTTEKNIDAGSLLIAWPLFVLLVFMLASFWLGERYEEQKLNRDFKLGL